MLERGDHTAPDGRADMEWYRRAADAGNKNAMVKVVRLARCGTYGPPDLREAALYERLYSDSGGEWRRAWDRQDRALGWDGTRVEPESP